MASSSERVRRCRLKQNGHFAAPMKRRAGRPWVAAPTRNSELRRHRRDRTTAPAVLRQLLQQLLRLRIIAKHVLVCTSDVRRQQRLAHSLRCSGASEETVCLLLLVDRPLRDARLSKVLLEAFTRLYQQRHSEQGAAWSSIKVALRLYRECGVRSRFWSGRAALTADKMVSSVQRRAVTAIAQSLTKTERVHVSTAMAQVQSWDGVGPYHAYDTLRSLRAVLGLKLHCEQQAAENMSMKVAMLAGILPLAEVVRIVRQANRVHRGRVHLGDAQAHQMLRQPNAARQRHCGRLGGDISQHQCGPQQMACCMMLYLDTSVRWHGQFCRLVNINHCLGIPCIAIGSKFCCARISVLHRA